MGDDEYFVLRYGGGEGDMALAYSIFRHFVAGSACGKEADFCFGNIQFTS